MNITKESIAFEELKQQIIEALKPLKPNKIILFGSYAYGTPNKDSDIDLFLIKDDLNDSFKYELQAREKIRELIYKYKIGFDILSASTQFLSQREDYFYKVDILQKGELLYEQNSVY